MQVLDESMSEAMSGAESLAPVADEVTPSSALPWYAAYVCTRHEKQIARQLEERRMNCFLPLYRSVRRWKDRRKELDLVLFPGYVFVQLDLQDRLKVLQLPGVVRFVSFNGHPAALPESEIEILRNGLKKGIHAEPHPYLKVGRKVRVKHGPLAGAEGILVRRKEKFRVVLSIDAIMRSVAVEVDEADVEAR
jgi:transcription antitermination factor NusG